ncbi:MULTISPECIES: HI0074 family nucleotidyltransferase substrate-binding subunit [unclassified Hydrogenobaculum]|jgi:nucleotidyltransferase substrate binding protein, HI0074 family|uniref:HI0074 family nucleotidyltransferase substrate-binding subunit n=1 Tax=unclassified Hydrogenobaculum TaxID=2622382 RepID=UPI0001C50DB2|nr:MULTISPECIES: HI0074 family nucleotidyltransferase substrate-binding subunit [unclassified Hydrogenobaculum]AEF19941.1 nucleotidyltransferase substrate binding protein, HI0074 family [Hydrogenobaculum sp. 3684]AEG47226.1 nucleotidyltransferase substrate binding protein, HI0074 family [Hydrogenobaculum sp. SHO]AGG15875.1 nucleotidyltransferase substrate binding protein, HI0074 family [Hydrogenobaculum sp. HO]AGH94175.1 nucleotidyltransferase substrate binding protein, HI0074 family [Hydrogeno
MALDRLLSDLKNAFSRLKESYDKTINSQNTADYSFFRDSTIQRFEFTIEILWKTVKEFLKLKEGIECRSPKSCIRDFFGSGYLSSQDVVTLLEAIDDRNLTSHTYHEEVADKIFQNIKKYLPVIKSVINEIEKNI